MVFSGFDPIKGIEVVRKTIVSDGFKWEILKQPLSTEIDCTRHNCKFTKVDREIFIDDSRAIGFEKWLCSELWIRVVAEIDGCNIANANIYPGSQSFIGFYVPRTYEVQINVSVSSNIKAESSGCPGCCQNAECVEFYISSSSKSFLGTGGSKSTIIQIYGNDGTIKKDGKIPDQYGRC